MAEPICRREELHISPPSYYFSPQPSRRRVDFVGENNQRTLSPNSCASSSTNTTEYSMIGENSRCEDTSPFLGYPMPKMGDGFRISRTKKEARTANVKTFKLVEPNHDKQRFYTEDGFRSRSLEPSPYNSFKQHHIPTTPILTPNLVRTRIRQQPQVSFSTPESDYEITEKVLRRPQRITAPVRRTESSRHSYKILQNHSQSNSGDAKVRIDTDITPKASPRPPGEVTPKATLQFGARKRFNGLTAPVRRELLAPHIQRKNIRSVKTDDEDSEKDDDFIVETKPKTLAEVLKQRNGIYEVEEPKMTGPSNLLHALKEVKYAEKEQLGSAPQTELRRITLFDLINEKERRHRLRSPPPIPPKSPRRNVSFTDQSPSRKKNENSVLMTVEVLESMSLTQAFPSLPTPLKGTSPKKIIDVSADISKNAPVILKTGIDENIEKEPTPPISQNPFVQWDRLKTQPLLKSNKQASRPEDKSTSPCSSGVGTNGLDEDGPVTVSSTNSANTLNSLSSPEWPKPEKITARPQSHQCSPDPLEEKRIQRKVSKETANGSAKNHINRDFSSVRVSLIAAPKTDALNFENNFIDAGSNASNSSRASTVFSYPWDLPPPQSDHSSSSATPPCPLKWATLQRHLTEYENQSKHRDSTLRANSVELRDSVGNEINDKQPKNGLFKLPTVLLNDPLERADDDKTSSGDEQFFEILSDNPNTPDDDSSFREGKEHLSQPTSREEGLYDTIGDDSPSCDRILEGVSEKDVPSPCVDISTPASIESFQNQSSQQYVYAEVKLSSDTSTSSSLAFHTPPIPTHPSRSKAKTISPEIQVFDEIENKKEQVKAKEISFDLPSSISISSGSIDLPNNSEGKSESRSSVTEFGKHLERFVCGLTNDKNSAFCKHVSTFIDCTIKQLGDNPQKTLQNVRQFMDGVRNFLQTSHETELQEAIDAEGKDLRGLQYLDVAQELEKLIQVAVLRPLHRKLIENLQKHGCGTISPENAEEFTNVVKKEYQNIPNLNEVERRWLENQLFEPVKRAYAQLSRSFRPTDKLNHLVDIFRRIDSQISFSLSSGQLNDSSNTTKLTVYAIVLALADLLKPPKRISTKTRNQKEGKRSDISRIEVHRLYLEALISPACLASSAEGCRRLTDLICLLRYIDNFNRYEFPASAIRMLYLRQIQSTELEEIPWSPNLYKLRRSFTDNIQEALQRSTNAALTTGSFSPPSWKELIRNRKDREGSIKTSSSTSFSGSSFVVLAANESKKTLIPFEVPLRSSLTVRELCNMLALKLTVFDSKDFTLFFHSASADIPMSDNLHLEPFLTQNYGEECASSVGSLGSIDSFCENSSQPSTPKMSNIRRLFRRRKRIASSDSSLRCLESPKPSRRRFIEGQDKERRPSIDWSSMGRRNPRFVLIYRRRSDDVVLYASNLFECLPNAGKLI